MVDWDKSEARHERHGINTRQTSAEGTEGVAISQLAAEPIVLAEIELVWCTCKVSTLGSRKRYASSFQPPGI